MVKTRGVKILIVVLLAILSITSFSLAATGIIYEIKQKQEKPEAWYLFTATTMSKEAYDRQSEFGIQDLDGLKSFMEAVEAGYSFKNKKVSLLNNIECYGYGIGFGSPDSYFQGSFDGNSYSLINGMLMDNYSTGEGGLFAKIDSNTSIKNLCLSAFSVDATSNAGEAGFITYYANGGIIENCMIDDCYSQIPIDLGSPEFILSGILASGSATIKDCYVNVSIDERLKYYYRYSGGSGTISNCVANDGYLDNTTVKDAKSATVSNCYNSKEEGFSKLDKSSQGSSKSDSTWYYGGSEYNFGWPYLRSFISSWTTITIKAGTGGTVSPSSIQVPNTVDSTIMSKGKGSTSQSFSICLQDISATPSAGYQFVNWTYSTSSSLTYTANFEEMPVILKFQEYDAEEQDSDDVYQIVVPGGGYEDRSDGDPYVFKVSKDTEISITFAKGELTKDGCYTNCTIAFKNIDGDNCRVGFLMLYSNNNDGSSPADKYYIESLNIGLNPIATESGKYTVTVDTVLSVWLEEKTYNVGLN